VISTRIGVWRLRSARPDVDHQTLRVSQPETVYSSAETTFLAENEGQSRPPLGKAGRQEMENEFMNLRAMAAVIGAVIILSARGRTDLRLRFGRRTVCISRAPITTTDAACKGPIGPEPIRARPDRDSLPQIRSPGSSRALRRSKRPEVAPRVRHLSFGLGGSARHTGTGTE